MPPSYGDCSQRSSMAVSLRAHPACFDHDDVHVRFQGKVWVISLACSCSSTSVHLSLPILRMLSFTPAIIQTSLKTPDTHTTQPTTRGNSSSPPPPSSYALLSSQPHLTHSPTISSSSTAHSAPSSTAANSPSPSHTSTPTSPHPAPNPPSSA